MMKQWSFTSETNYSEDTQTVTFLRLIFAVTIEWGLFLLRVFNSGFLHCKYAYLVVLVYTNQLDKLELR